MESSCHDDRGGRGEGGGEHSTSAVEEALRRQMEMQKVLQSQLEVRCGFQWHVPAPGSSVSQESLTLGDHLCGMRHTRAA